MPAPARPRSPGTSPRRVDGKVLFAAFTGKAALVMRSKGCERASTIHSLIYSTRESGEEVPSFDLWDDAPASKAKLIVIDECSMVDAELGRDLMSFGVPLLVLGDPAQLPPIQGGGFFTEAEPDAMLTEVHRQAAGQSDHPAVDGHPRRQPARARRLRRDAGGARATSSIRSACSTPIRCWSAATPRGAPTTCGMRERRGFAGALPATGDKLVCLRNNKRKGLFNGGAVVGEGAADDRGATSSRCGCSRTTASPASGVKVSVRPECFTGGIEELEWPMRKRYDEFDYGYVLTVHKAQGSQWDDVVLFDESSRFAESRAALALHRRHAGGEAVDSGDVASDSAVAPCAGGAPIRANLETRCA